MWKGEHVGGQVLSQDSNPAWVHHPATDTHPSYRSNRSCVLFVVIHGSNYLDYAMVTVTI